MKVLFDHNLPHKLRNELGALCPHEIVTASYMGWRKLKNGELLRTAEENGFDVFMTGDQTLVYEQNLAGRRLTILALSANNWPIIKDYMAEILAAINSAPPGSFQTVDCGTFTRNTLTSRGRRFPCLGQLSLVRRHVNYSCSPRCVPRVREACTERQTLAKMKRYNANPMKREN